MIEIKIDKFGNKAYYKNGLLHRKEGPGIEWNNGDREWYLNGKRHRKDGPAVEYNEKKLHHYKKYWYNGEKIECNSTEEFIQIIKSKG